MSDAKEEETVKSNVDQAIALGSIEMIDSTMQSSSRASLQMIGVPVEDDPSSW
jgi:hypothetical protein